MRRTLPTGPPLDGRPTQPTGPPPDHLLRHAEQTRLFEFLKTLPGGGQRPTQPTGPPPDHLLRHAEQTRLFEFLKSQISTLAGITPACTRCKCTQTHLASILEAVRIQEAHNEADWQTQNAAQSASSSTTTLS